MKCLAEKSCETGEVINVNYPIQYTRANPFKKCVPALANLKSIYVKGDDDKFDFSYSLGECTSPNGEITDKECLDNATACYSKISINRI
jgi:hypothetical protein